MNLAKIINKRYLTEQEKRELQFQRELAEWQDKMQKAIAKMLDRELLAFSMTASRYDASEESERREPSFRDYQRQFHKRQDYSWKPRRRR